MAEAGYARASDQLAELGSPEIKLSGVQIHYRCSFCKKTGAGHYGILQHINKTPACLEAGAKVETYTTDMSGLSEAILDHAAEVEVKSQPVQVEETPKPKITRVEVAPEYEHLYQPVKGANGYVPSMAQQAAGGSPPWGGVTDEDDDEEEEEPLLQISSGITATNPFPDEMRAMYRAYLRDGFVGTIGDWAWEFIKTCHVLLGVKVELLPFTPEDRALMLAKAGLADG